MKDICGGEITESQRMTRHIRTDKMPFSVGDEAGGVAAVVAFQLQVDSAHVVRPRAELHLAQLVVEREPRDVDLARAEEQSRRHPEAVAVRRHHDVRRKRAVNVLVGATPVLHSCVTFGCQ